MADRSAGRARRRRGGGHRRHLLRGPDLHRRPGAVRPPRDRPGAVHRRGDGGADRPEQLVSRHGGHAAGRAGGDQRPHRRRGRRRAAARRHRGRALRHGDRGHRADLAFDGPVLSRPRDLPPGRAQPLHPLPGDRRLPRRHRLAAAQGLDRGPGGHPAEPRHAPRPCRARGDRPLAARAGLWPAAAGGAAPHEPLPGPAGDARRRHRGVLRPAAGDRHVARRSDRARLAAGAVPHRRAVAADRPRGPRPGRLGGGSGAGAQHAGGDARRDGGPAAQRHRARAGGPARRRPRPRAARRRRGEHRLRPGRRAGGLPDAVAVGPRAPDRAGQPRRRPRLRRPLPRLSGLWLDAA